MWIFQLVSPEFPTPDFFFVKTDLPFLCIINKNAACVLLFKTKTKYFLKNSISLPLRKRERG